MKSKKFYIQSDQDVDIFVGVSLKNFSEMFCVNEFKKVTGLNLGKEKSYQAYLVVKEVKK